YLCCQSTQGLKARAIGNSVQIFLGPKSIPDDSLYFYFFMIKLWKKLNYNSIHRQKLRQKL
ncbi:MAG: hypothetical protein KKE12_16845, partial [Proteobacteria bacterium]|nr:hypothetical protein [Pseudomonadota bacterium]